MNLELLKQVIPQLLVIAAIAGFIGWLVRGKATPPPKPVQVAPRERSKSSDAALEQSRASHKALKLELDALRAHSVPRADLEAGTAELEIARQSLAAEKNRAASLDAELKKSRETIRQLSLTTKDADKSRNDRAFALENELSKAREQLAVLQSRPDDTAHLQAEIERLRESVAVTTRYAGELRKREAAAQEALAKLQEKAANSPNPGPITPLRSGDSDRVTAAKAQVARLNALRQAEAIAAAAQPPDSAADMPPVPPPAAADPEPAVHPVAAQFLEPVLQESPAADSSPAEETSIRQDEAPAFPREADLASAPSEMSEPAEPSRSHE